ncbi:MAG: diphosphomevalonate decarboxylase [Proteobacteria bacterium]|nr:diphosphomevalonate decarboxylase [Pseudomonadota bacterium]
MRSATAIAHPNIALIKYWGKRDRQLNLPSVSSLSLTLDTFQTQTTVKWGSHSDSFVLNGTKNQGKEAQKVFSFLNLLEPNRPYCQVESFNNFPTAAGLASSSSAFAALALAASSAGQLPQAALDQRHTLSVLARQGSGSACRSLWGGWVLWNKGHKEDGTDSHAHPIHPSDYWDLKLIVAVVSSEPKKIGSTAGMIHTEKTSPLYPLWVQSSDDDLEEAVHAIEHKDIQRLGAVMEHSMLKMHATMLAARPAVRYLKPQSLSVLDKLEDLRSDGVLCYGTMDAGPNVKILCEAKHADRISQAISPLTQAVHILGVGSDPQIIDIK